MVIWLIGMSGSGKTTIAVELVKLLRKSGCVTALLDGDLLRDVWGDRIGHDIESRRINAQRLSRLTQYLHDQQINVVGAVLSIFPEWQAWNRKNIPDYYEVFLDVQMPLLIARDTKGLYAEALAGKRPNVVGIDIPFPQPAFDFRITEEDQRRWSPNEIARHLLDQIGR